MPKLELEPGTFLFYRDDDFTDPWTTPEVAFLLHGNSENGGAWNSWMPYLGRQFRVVRPDMRGFGRSTPMPENFPWSVDKIIDDYVRLADHLGIDKFHLIGAKIGGGIALRFAATRGERLRSLTVCAARVRGVEAVGGRAAQVPDQVRKGGVISWARETMGGRLGSDCPPEMLEGQIQMMGATPASTQIGFMTNVPGIDVTGDLPHITCPTLVLASSGSKLNTAASTREWAATIPRAEVVEVPGDSYHIAASHPEFCARATLAFIARCAAAV